MKKIIGKLDKYKDKKYFLKNKNLIAENKTRFGKEFKKSKINDGFLCIYIGKLLIKYKFKNF